MKLTKTHLAFGRWCRDVTPILLIVALWLVFFWPVVFGNRQLAYRDTASHYYPLFKWIDQQWAEGHVPLWNPLENLGQPVVGDGSSSVFYPGKLIFFLRALPYPARFGLFVSFHVLLAALGAFWCARGLRCTAVGAGLAAIAYAFGAPVIFQTCNVVYLIGAAWLPIALGCLWRFKRLARTTYLIGLAASVALMILGGDPQMAYHALLISGLVILFARIGAFGSRPPLPILGRLACIGALLLLVLGLSAVQWVPSWQWSQCSERAAYVLPRNVYESARHLFSSNQQAGRDVVAGLFGPPIADSHHADLYEFSQPPSSLMELVLPNASGKMFPMYQRWTNALPSADRVWTASLYVGLVVLLLALWQFRFWGRRKTDCFLSYLALIFLLGSFGWFGAVYVINDVGLLTQGAGISETLGSQVGGVYWLMVVLLPLYVSFRYPAKLTVVFSLALCLLAGRGLMRIRRNNVRPVLALLTLAGLADLVFIGTIWSVVDSLATNEFSTEWRDPIFGAFDRVGFERGAWLTFAQVAVVVALGIGVILFFRRSLVTRIQAQWAILLLSAVEVSAAVWWMVPTLEVKPPSVGLIERSLDVQRVVRFPIHQSMPTNWKDAGTLESYHQWQIETLFPKQHLAQGVSLLGSYSSLEPLDYSVFSLMAAGLSDERDHFPEWALDALSVSHGMEYGTPTAPGWVEFVPRAQQYLRRPAFFVQGFSTLGAINERDYHQVIQRTSDVLDRLRETNGQAVMVEFDTPGAFNADALMEADSSSAPVKLTRTTPQRLELQLTAPAEGLLVVTDYWDPDWKAYVRKADGPWERQKILRVNRILRGVQVPAGEVDVVMVYRPIGLYGAAIVSLLSWILFASVAGRLLLLHRYRLTVTTSTILE